MFCSTRIGVVVSALWIAFSQPVSARDVLEGPIPAKVTRVIDGDTVEVDAHIWPGQTVRVAVRLKGIDAPEIFRSSCAREKALGADAKEYLVQLFEHDDAVSLFHIKEGKYAGRVVANIKTSTGQEPAQDLISNGLATTWAKRARANWCADNVKNTKKIKTARK
ncbi:MAG: thermonuclease family protein [Pseudomonadota bacterium]